jgi:hypothetical protein
LQKNTRSANVASISRFARRSAGSLVNQFDVPELARLLSQRSDQDGMAVTERSDGDAREVDVHASGLVPDARTLAAHGNSAGA